MAASNLPKKGLTQLYPGPDAPTDFDIVAIHGLDGDSIQTWTCPKTNALWIRDFLKLSFPRARIFTYGYDVGRVWFSKEIANVEDVAVDLLRRIEIELDRVENPAEPDSKRPIVFICHSLGGIILKTALVKANERRTHYRFIFDHPKVVMFMATPHLGSSMATFFDRLSSTLPFPDPVMTKKNIKFLRSHSDELFDLTKRFVERVDEFKAIVSFYETQRHPKARVIIVDEHSATLQNAREQSLALAADHNSICKFESTADPNYALVLGSLRKMIRRSLGVNLDVRASPAIGLRLETPDYFTTPNSSCPPSAYASPHGTPRTRSYEDLKAMVGPSSMTVETKLDLAHRSFIEGCYEHSYEAYRSIHFVLQNDQPRPSELVLTYLGLARCLVRMDAREQRDRVEGRALMRVPVEQRDLLAEAGRYIGKMRDWKHGMHPEVARKLLGGLGRTEEEVSALNQGKRAEGLLRDIQEINERLLGQSPGLITW